MNKPKSTAIAVMSAAIAVTFISGCAQYGAITGAVRTTGAEIADKELDAAVYVLCRGITVGAWVRRFGNNEEAANAWKVLCTSDVALTTPAKETP
jgi:hypothetical protein